MPPVDVDIDVVGGATGDATVIGSIAEVAPGALILLTLMAVDVPPGSRSTICLLPLLGVGVGTDTIVGTFGL